MNLIDKYIHLVVSKLPKDQRMDVGKELKSNILDMLPDSYTEEDVLEAIASMGSPNALASQYRGTQNYLIGPRWYDHYIQTLRNVAPILIVVLLAVNMFQGLIEFGNAANITNIIDFFANFITNAISSFVSVVTWITLVFIFLEKRSNINDTHWDWSVDQLKSLPDPIQEPFSISEIVAEMGILIFVIAGLYFFSDSIGVYNHVDGAYVMVAPLFNETMLATVIPILCVIAGFSILNAVFKLKFKRWTLPLVFYNIALQLITTLGFVYLLVGTSFVNPEVFTIIQKVANLSPSSLRFIEFLPTIIAFVALISGVYNAYTYYRDYKNQKEITY